MSEIGWKDIAELVGIGAIVASLLFVGLQMKQSQDIAIAAQYQARADTVIEFHNANKNGPGAEMWGGLVKLWPDHELGVSDRAAAMIQELTEEQLGWLYFTEASYFRMHENHHFQYQAGFLDEESYFALQNGLRSMLQASPLAIEQWRGAKYEYRESFAELVDSIISDMDSDDAE